MIASALTGFTVDSFTSGVQYAYRLALARRLQGNVTVSDVIISNVRPAGQRRQRRQRRRLAATAAAAQGVAFDAQVSAANATAAAALKASAEALQPEAIVAELRAQIDVVKAAGDFADVSASYPAPAAIVV